MVIFLSVLTTSLTYAEVKTWTTNGPADYSANALVIDPKNPMTLYVGTEEGIVKSTTSAESWLKLSLPFATEVLVLAVGLSSFASQCRSALRDSASASSV